MASASDIRAGRAVVELAVDDRKLTQGLRAADGKFKAFGASANRSIAQALRPTAAIEAAAFRSGGRGFNASRALLDTGFGGSAAGAFQALGGTSGFAGGLGGMPVVAGRSGGLGLRQLAKGATVGAGLSAATQAALGGDLKTSAVTGLIGGVAALAATAGPAGLAVAGLAAAITGLGYGAFKAHEFFTGAGKVDPEQAKKNFDIEQAIFDASVKAEEERGRLIKEHNQRIRERLAAESRAVDIARQNADDAVRNEITAAGLQSRGLRRGAIENFAIQEAINRGRLSQDVGFARQQQNIIADGLEAVGEAFDRMTAEVFDEMEVEAEAERIRDLGRTPAERRIRESQGIMDALDEGLITEDEARSANEALIIASGELTQEFEEVAEAASHMAAMAVDFVDAFSQQGANAILRHTFGGGDTVEQDQLGVLRDIHRELRDQGNRGPGVVLNPANVN